MSSTIPTTCAHVALTSRMHVPNGSRPGQYNFAIVSQAIGLREVRHSCKNGRGPRIHDLRHSFAVGTLLRWYRSGVDPAARLPHLSTFLGHINPTATAVYLTITAELLQEANRRFSTFAPGLTTEVAP